MSSSSTRIAAALVAGLLTTTSATSIEAGTVMRCNLRGEGNVFVPVLIAVTDNGRTVYTFGSDIPSRETVYNSAAALAFAARQLGVDAGSLSYSACVASFQDTGIAAPPVDEEEEEEEEVCGPCGPCGPCYPT